MAQLLQVPYAVSTSGVISLSSDTSVLRPQRYENSLTTHPLENPVTPALVERSSARVLAAPPDVEPLDVAPGGVERRHFERPAIEPVEARRLVDAATAGDAAAWEALYRALYPRLRAFFVRRVGAEHADDGVSETMTRAVASIDRFQWTDAGFDGWVFGIARHVSVDHHRRQERVRRYHHITKMFSGNKTDGTAPVEQDLVIGDDQALIRDLFTQLAPAEQEVLELRVIAGLSAEQVGEVLGHKAGAVRTAQSRALAHLRELMVHHGG
jgi:RNA polymerase sigma-70 factor, ECF subfamily